MCGSETWCVTKTSTKNLQTFTNRCLRNILNIRWLEVVSNEELWNKAKQTHIKMEIKKRKWGWIGHTLRKPVYNISRQALEWNPQGNRKVGHPKQTWRQSTKDEIKAAGTTWAEQPEPSSVEGSCCGPMFPRELRGLRRRRRALLSKLTKVVSCNESDVIGSWLDFYESCLSVHWGLCVGVTGIEPEGNSTSCIKTNPKTFIQVGYWQHSDSPDSWMQIVLQEWPELLRQYTNI